LSFGTSVPYSRFHTTGGKHLPKREHVGMTEPTVDEITEESADAMVEFLKYTG
jgi:phage gpG-like protein